MAAELTEAGVSEAFARYSPQALYDRHQQVIVISVFGNGFLLLLTIIRRWTKRWTRWTRASGTCVR